jgi:Lar family restriction alleviation protein
MPTLPCPFCGSTSLRYGRGTNTGWRYFCSDCRAEGPPAWPEKKGEDAHDTQRLREEHARENWNRRTILMART